MNQVTLISYTEDELVDYWEIERDGKKYRVLVIQQEIIEVKNDES